ncbi:Membrane protein involved in the export of O-antigen and teichoic acid [Mucilaginibacter pineti]|uniref:Membrane protein involved in the export of O-antigen and teichoic acid n=2 Tax=Mucilaginibacter pineti TaxID=1391627 RepID=A0A1G6W8H1_9SPHI|nr:Membrane protein involved in the export of O-antigen and teichoic acid [Mucilaginibacter pineti]
MIAQMALVPLYLTHWNVKTYGVWLSIQAFISVMATLDNGHQTFLAYEFLKFGRIKLDKLREYLWSGAVVGLFLGILQIIITILLLYTGLLGKVLGEAHLEDQALIRSIIYVLFALEISWLFCGSVGGIFVRVLSPFGYYPRFSWWGVLSAVVTSIAPAIAVVYGGDLLLAGEVLAIATIAFNIPQFIDMYILMRKENIGFVRPSIKTGFMNFKFSLLLSGKGLLENVRQQGVRIILTPMVGASGLANFSTLRTGANVALQGLNTIVNPLEPELMRFLHQKDQARSEASFGTIWIVLMAIMAPMVLIVQMFIGPIYTIWTRGQIPFNPILFATLSLGVLVYAVSQPAIAIVVGNNLLRSQLVLSIISAIVVILGLVIFIPYFGLMGAGIALLLAEIISTNGYRYVARNWLQENGLIWPKASSRIASASVWITAGGMASMIWIPSLKWVSLILALALLVWNFWRYWKVLPPLATEKAMFFLSKLPGMKHLIIKKAN